LRRCTERCKPCIQAYLALATAIVTLRARASALLIWPLFQQLSGS
jgi:hypothetical protein